MGVYIKGMEMPKDCRECKMQVYYSFLGRTWCKSADIILADNYKPIPFDGRPTWCPLVEVPEPHGRLVDADKLIMHLADYQLQESPVWGSNGYGNADKYEAITDCIDAVESACAVIEAEGER